MNNEKKLSDEQMTWIIRSVIANPEMNWGYDGLDMSGDNFLPNMQLLHRFRDYIPNGGDIIIPVFHEGSGSITKLSTSGEAKVVKDCHYGGWPTEEILLDIIKRNNPTLFSNPKPLSEVDTSTGQTSSLS